MVFSIALTIGIGVLCLAGVVAAAYEAGRKDLRREILVSWTQQGCRHCGAQVRATLVHVSGCTAGWPRPAGPETFPLPGELPE
jgi:hypothetical protein